MKPLLYSGPATRIELVTGKSATREVNLMPGQIYADLPENHPVIANLMARKLLHEAPVQPVKNDKTK